MRRYGKLSIITCPFFLIPGALLGQTNALVLSSGAVGPGGSVTLDLNLTVSNGDRPPAALQWNLSYSANDLASITVAAGPALFNADKTLYCNSATGSITCLA